MSSSGSRQAVPANACLSVRTRQRGQRPTATPCCEPWSANGPQQYTQLGDTAHLCRTPHRCAAPKPPWGCAPKPLPATTRAMAARSVARLSRSARSVVRMTAVARGGHGPAPLVPGHIEPPFHRLPPPNREVSHREPGQNRIGPCTSAPVIPRGALKQAKHDRVCESLLAARAAS